MIKKSIKGRAIKIVIFALSLIISVSFASAAEIMIIGHRGAAGLLPENTMSGFKKVMEIGVDAFELDVHLTLDNVVVVTHDYRLKPEITRDSMGKWIKKNPLIKDLTLAQVQSFDVGKLKRSTKYAKKYPEQQSVDGENIPTLLEVIKLIKLTDENVKLFIELKTSPINPEESNSPELLANAVAKILQEEKFIDRATVISFDWRGLKHIKKIIPKVHTSHLTIRYKNFDTVQKKKTGPSPWMAGIDIDDYDSIPQSIKDGGGESWTSHHYHASMHGKGMTSKLIKKAHAVGLDVFVFTVDKKRDMKRMIKMGVDGIITNRPDILKAILKR